MGIFKKLKQGFLFIGETVQKVINFILLFLVYFIGVGITSLIGKLSRKSFLFIFGDKNSYWDVNKIRKESMEESKRLF